VRAAFIVAQATAKRMVETRTPGSLIHISSQMAFTTGPGRSVYCATKAALEGMSRAIAAELGALGIRSNTLCPTFVETPLAAEMLKDEKVRNLVVSKIKFGRVGQVEELMGAIVYLASDASNYVTGRDIVVDGGHTLNVWLHPLERALPPLVGPKEEVVSLKHDLDLLGIPHDEDGLVLD
jgi:NAD(P)-dependent dehydrogenase (short-subunit alcohol dehydrogenase family)